MCTLKQVRILCSHSWVLDFVSVVSDAIQTAIDYVCASRAESPVCVLHVYTYREVCVLDIAKQTWTFTV